MKLSSETLVCEPSDQKTVILLGAFASVSIWVMMKFHWVVSHPWLSRLPWLTLMSWELPGFAGAMRPEARVGVGVRVAVPVAAAGTVPIASAVREAVGDGVGVVDARGAVTVAVRVGVLDAWRGVAVAAGRGGVELALRTGVEVAARFFLVWAVDAFVGVRVGARSARTTWALGSVGSPSGNTPWTSATMNARQTVSRTARAALGTMPSQWS